MRRLWAHIAIAVACIFTSVAVFPTLLKGIQTNGDYQKRRQFTYQLTERLDEDNNVVTPLGDESAKNIAKEMEKRLIASGVSSYELTTSGEDIINVAFTAKSSSQYNQITTFLGFSGSFALMNKDPNGEPLVADDFLNGNAYLKNNDINEYPTLIIPVKTESEAYKNLIKYAQDNPEEQTSGEGEDAETTQSAPIYLIYNYEQGDTYKALTDSNRFNEKILLTFNALTDDDLYYDENKNSFAQVVGYQDANGNGYADADEVAAAYDQANFLFNLFNASVLDYNVEVIRGLADGTQVWVDAKVEGIFSYTKIAWTSTLTAIVAAIVIISLLLVVFYRLGALSIVTTTFVSTILSFLFMVSVGMEYNTLALVGLVSVALLSLISGIIYLNKLKEESYRGRTLKKANSEASRKSTLPIVDVHFVSVVIGLLCYLLGGTALHSFASILLLGSLISVLINLFGLKAMVWLATNTTKLTGRYDLFGMDNDKIPDHASEEKQKFFGAYADKDLTKSKKPMMIGALAAFVLAVTGISVAGGLKGGNIISTNAIYVNASEIYIEDTVRVLSDEKSEMTEDAVKAMLNDIKLYEKDNETVTFDDNDTHATLGDYINNIATFDTSDSITDEGTTKTYASKYFVVYLNNVLDGDKLYAKVKGDTSAETYTLNTVLADYFQDYNTEYGSSDPSDEKVQATIDLKTVERMNNVPSADWGKVALATTIAILVITLYMLIRYRLSRGLASIIFPVVSSAIILAFFVLLSAVGLNLPATISVLIPVTTFFSYVFMILIANKEREIIVDNKDKDTSYEHRQELSIRALGIAYTPILVVAVIGIYMFINFFGFGPQVNSFIYLACLLGTALSLLLISVIYVPVANFFYKLFLNVNFEPKFKKSKKTGNAQIKKSSEPEEAIFIGIND